MKIQLKIYLFTLLFIANVLNAQDGIKVISYNMMGMKPDTDWETRMEYIIQHIIQLNPDIIGLQEINQTSGGSTGDNMAQTLVDSLEAHFGENYNLYEQFTHTSWNQFDESIGIISKFPVIATNYLDLTPGVFPRKVVWNYINTPLGTVNFFNSHLSYMENHNSIRMQQVQEIMDFIVSKENTWAGQASILTGDLNCTPDSDPISLLVNEVDGSFYYSSYQYVNPSLNGYTVPAENPTRKIDYIFLKNNSEFGLDTSVVVIDEPYDGVHYPSDHRGLLTIFDQSPLVIGSNELTPSQFHFIGHYPNPFNPVLNIEYSLGTQNDVSIHVYNILGERVKTYLNKNMKIGFHRQNLKFSGLSTGIYYITIGTRSEFITQKCVYLK